ncbi:cyclin-I [Osmerus mordax]|uniref:cyclin-I n=1 Tax=Osmerus mordax TaxID=8014 RepID=UPI00350F1E0A
MKNPAVAENRRLVGLLEDALARELRLWKVPVFKSDRIQGTDISSFQYQDVILWLGERSRLFKLCPETFALGVCVLNRLLATVKAQPKYLKCIAFTSLILAAKINEEDDVIGSVKDLVVQSGCNFSTAEILRMERIILDKLHWDLYTATAVDFINIFHALLISSHPHLDAGARGAAQKRPCLQVALWTRQVQHCMACHQLWQFRGSTLALAIITLELETLTPDWFSVFTDLLKKAQIQSAEFIHCKEMVDEYLNSLEFSLPPNAVYIFDSTNVTKLQDEVEEGGGGVWGPGALLTPARGSGGEGDTDEFYDGFGCLYNEALEAGGGDMEGQVQKNVSPCPPLHPPGN